MPAQPSPSRLESFSDGVIAVIITIMVLELKVPPVDGFAGFIGIVPTLAVYLLSFVFTGIYWVNHHHLTDRLKRVDPLILWSNLGFLFSLSLLPFFTNYLLEKKMTSFAVSIYALSLFLDAVTFKGLDYAIARHMKQFKHDLYGTDELEERASENTKGIISTVMYLVAVPVSKWRPGLGAWDDRPGDTDLDRSKVWSKAPWPRNDVSEGIKLRGLAARISLRRNFER